MSEPPRPPAPPRAPTLEQRDVPARKGVVLRLAQWAKRNRHRCAPPGSWRDRAARPAARAFRVWQREGLRGVLQRLLVRALRMFRIPGVHGGDDVKVLFHEPYYLAQCGELADTITDPLHHYLSVGWRQGLNPHPLFDTRYYLESNPSVARAEINPLVHYATTGWLEGRSPSADFTHYLWLNPDIRNWKRSPLAHYVLHGFRESRPYRLPSAVEVDRGNVELRLPTARGSRKAPADRVTPAPRVLVHVHAYYVEHWELVAERLAAIPVPFDLAVTSDSQSKLDEVASSPGLKKLECTVQFLVGPNRGRDLAPLLVSLGRTALRYDLALHLHVKKSVERDPTFADRWMRHNLDCLLYDREYVAAVLSLFRNEARCGIIQPVPFGPIRPYLDWGKDLPVARGLLQRLGLPDIVSDERPLSFPAGSMFWFRPAAIVRMLDGAFTFDDFPEEPIPDDGTLAHAIERCFVPVAAHDGYHERSVAPLPPDEVPNGSRRPAVSVVIPVRDGAKYLHAAVQSAVRQRYGTVPLEILIVDNGSTDASAEIAAFYAESFSNVTLLRRAGGGAGAARNLGLENATGKYVFFLDADDLLAADGIEQLHRTALRTEAQVVVSRLRMYDERQSRAPLPAAYGAWGGRHDLADLCNRGDLAGLTAGALAELNGLFSDFGPCAKLYERAFLREHAIRFPESGNYEDNTFVYEAYLKSRRLHQVRSVTYLYRKLGAREGRSQSTEMRLRDVRDQIERLDELTARAEQIRNAELARLIKKCLLAKLSWLLDADAAVAEHLHTLRSDTEALLRRLDAAKNVPPGGALQAFMTRKKAKAAV